jgi:phosphoglycolate phosphatase
VTIYDTMLPAMDTSPAFIFDLDGTLVDTAPDLLTTLNRLLLLKGRPAVDTAELRRLVGRGARNLIAQAFKLTGAPIDAAEIETLYDAFLDDYGRHVADASRPFPGVIATLQQLKADGVRMGVLTNKPHGPTTVLVEALGMSSFFGVVVGGGLRPWLKPDRRLFEEVVAELGGPGSGTVMIGDSITDVETARDAGVPVILMSYGYTPEPAESLGADLVLDDFRDVPKGAARLLGIS